MQCDNAGTGCQVRSFSIDDFTWSARLHMQKLPGDLAALLGEKFLVEVLYPHFQQEGLSLVVPQKGCLLLTRKLRLNPLSLLLRAVRRPKAWPSLTGALWRKRDVSCDLSGYIEISFIFSEPGYGSELLDEAFRRHATDGFFALTAAAEGFYRKMGFQSAGVERRGDRQLRVFVRDKIITAA